VAPSSGWESVTGTVAQGPARDIPCKIAEVKWLPFNYGGNVYDLAHLHPCTMKYEYPADGEKASTVFKVDVTYGMHCFSCDPAKAGLVPPGMEYADARHVRVFDFGRYELSKQLPRIIEGLAERKCWNSGKGNFFTIEVITEDGEAADYDVFFAVSKSGQKGRINLFVQSAYIRDRQTLESSSPIKFRFILHNTLNRIAIKP
jgi:hypothetical protein